MSGPPIDAVAALNAPSANAAGAAAPTRPAASFADMLLGGIDKVNQQVLGAQSLATQFALDDSVPVHQVTFALEQARMAAELMLQIRSKLVEGYQDIMRMQL